MTICHESGFYNRIHRAKRISHSLQLFSRALLCYSLRYIYLKQLYADRDVPVLLYGHFNIDIIFLE